MDLLCWFIVVLQEGGILFNGADLGAHMSPGSLFLGHVFKVKGKKEFLQIMESRNLLTSP